jgi:NTP pyrophosphatase (non-canonical NTP hydrolase)
MEYKDMVAGLKKPGSAIVMQLTSRQADALHMTVGVAGEAGELLDAIKKWVIYQKPLDRENVVEELGDIEFYLEGLRQGLDIDRDETLEANMRKLGARYKGHQYSDEQAHARADKQ